MKRRIIVPTEAATSIFWSKVVVGAPGECWGWTGTKTKGYGAFQMTRGDRRSMVYAHRYSLALATGVNGDEACHRCDNPECCNPEHLWWGTHADNMRDAISKGRMDPRQPLPKDVQPRGERHGMAKLTEDGVREIRLRAASGEARSAIAKDHGVTTGAIDSVVSRKRWRHVA